jgi:phage terminase large subunit-like protein
MGKGLTPEQLRDVKDKLQLLYRKRAESRLFSLYPESGHLRRGLYPKHMAFLAAGSWARERCAIAANRSGKSYGLGGYEVALHATGLYPDWWQGRRFNVPDGIEIWAAGNTAQTTRDVCQQILLGPPHAIGTGLIPKDRIKDTKKAPGSTPDAIEQVLVAHENGSTSRLVFKSFTQERESFQGTGIHVIWLDEECKMAIYGECLLRTMTTNGIILVTFTPLLGLSEVVLNFMPNGQMPDEQGPPMSKFVVNATWEDVPHLTERDKKEILAGTPLYLRDARARGIPQLGSGAIYPILEEDIIFEDEWLYREGDGQVPVWFKRANGMDVGWNHETAAVFGAYDDKNDIVYIYRVYKQGRAEPSTHVQAIKAPGEWIPTVCDPSANASSQIDGRKLLDIYGDLGLYLFKADNSVESGLLAVWERLVSGRLKVARSCGAWFDEFRVYRRDEKGKVVKLNDDLMDCTRYLISSGLILAAEPPYEDAYPDEVYVQAMQGASGRSAWTGY